MRPDLELHRTPSGASFGVFVRRDRRYGFHWHHHADHELTLVHAGGGRRFVGDAIDAYRAPDLALLGPDLPHTWEAPPGAGWHRAVVVMFPPTFVAWLRATPELAPVAELFTRAARGVAFSPRATASAAPLMRRLDRERGARRLATMLELLDLLAADPGARAIAGAGFRGALDREGRRRIDAVTAYLARHLGGAVSQRRAAAIAGMTPSSFSRFFRRTTGRTFTAELRERRIARACGLLQETELPIAGVALEAGFANLSNFNRAFAALRGTTPRRYRREFARR